MARPQITVYLVAFYSLALFALYCQANEQPANQPNNQQMYGYLRPAAQFLNTRQIRIPNAELNSARLPFELEMLAQQPLVKRERTSHGWDSCEFSPMSCLLRRRRQVI